jgi:outer membrane protein assembly factor BamD
VITRFPSSTLAGDAAYYEARSYFELAPPFTLDQQFMTKSFNTFQRFLEDYPEHTLSDSAYVYMAKAREQLAIKEYRAAELYYQLGEYASAILYSDAVLSNYYDTKQASHAQFLKARSYYRLKDWTKAREEFDNYIQRFPDAAHVVRARDLRATSAEREAEITAQAATE